MAEFKFETYSGIDYLKIDIANNMGLDKLNFQDRIDWFNENIPYRVKKDTSEAHLKALVGTLHPEEPELFFAGLCAYKAYLNQEESGYRISLDATSSGIQLMSAITTDIKGMLLTNLIDNTRHDSYTEIYELLKEAWKHNYQEELNISRKAIKQAIMVMMYGGSKSILKYLNNDERIFDMLMSCCNVKINGAYKLCKVLLNCIEPECTGYSWVTPDNFHVKSDILVQYKETRTTDKGTIHVKYKDLGKDPYYKGNVANLIHSLDGTLMRELVGRCNYDRNNLLATMNRIERILNSGADKIVLLSKTTGSKMNSQLQELIGLYNQSGFFSVRILDYINSEADVLGLITETNEIFLNKLYDLVKRMLSYNPFDVLVVHDCFTCLPNNGNYVRYWYKEIIAEMVEVNILKFMLNQLPNGMVQYKKIFEKDMNTAVAEFIRNSNYAIC